MAQKMASGKELTPKQAANYAYLQSAVTGLAAAASNETLDRAMATGGLDETWTDPGQAKDMANILLEDFVP